MTIAVANVATTATFQYWLATTNQLANALSVSVVTTDAGASSTPAAGNAAITGTFTANAVSVGNSTANIALTAPTSGEISSGDYVFASNGTWQALSSGPAEITVVTTGAVLQLIDAYAMANFLAAEYVVVVEDNNANNHYASKLMTMHDTSSGYITEYASMTSNSAMGTFSASANATHLLLNFAPVSTNTTVKFIRTIV